MAGASAPFWEVRGLYKVFAQLIDGRDIGTHTEFEMFENASHEAERMMRNRYLVGPMEYAHPLMVVVYKQQPNGSYHNYRELTETGWS